LTERLVFCHKNKLHQDIVIVLIELLASKGDLHTVYGRQHGVFQHTAVNALHTAKQRAPGHVVGDRPGFIREQRELDHLGSCRGRSTVCILP
jgi:hypothetical protein